MSTDHKTYFKNKKITLIGLGVLGRGVGDAEFLAQEGADLIVTDLKSEKDLALSLKRLEKFKNIQYVLGEHRFEDFKNRDLIIKAAGVPLDSPYIAEARKNKIPIEMDESLFVKLSDTIIVGVTGTKGKTTTTQLIYEILKKAFGSRVHLGGNIKGVATLPLLNKVKPRDIIVMELSSWQLQGFKEAKISPHIAVFTNFTPDHMNYYKNDMNKYFQDKSCLFKFQGNDDFLISSKQAMKAIERHYKKPLSGNVIITSPEMIPKGWKIKLLGEHNKENIALATQAAAALGVPQEISMKVVEKFTGIEGRLELVKIIGGVKFYNDTTATTPNAVIAALKALKENKGKIILIAGGHDKNAEYVELVSAVKKYVKFMILFSGSATAKIVLSLKSFKNYQEVGDMREAMLIAKWYAKAGDIILLSPGAASFGMFKNEFDRGEQFNYQISTKN